MRHTCIPPVALPPIEYIRDCTLIVYAVPDVHDCLNIIFTVSGLDGLGMVGL